MRFSYKLIEDGTSWVAECVEVDALGEGRTPGEAFEALRTAIEERMFRADGIAPPQTTPRASIELELIEHCRSLSPDATGGG